MKPITVRFWVSDEAPDPMSTSNGSRLDIPSLVEFLSKLEPNDVSAHQLSEKEIQNIADGIANREYHETVSGIVEDLKRAVKDGEISDSDAATDWLHETIDGHHDVIYTSCAMEICRQSSNDGAYFDAFGSEGAVTDGGIEWSKLAYCALEADVREKIGDLDEWFRCSECNGDVDEDDLKAAEGDNFPVCADCRGENDEDETDEETREAEVAEDLEEGK